MRKPFVLAPPSARSTSTPPGSRSRTSATWNAIPSSAARTTWARVVPRVIPLITPRASGVPVRRAEARERRHERDTARRLDGARQPLALSGVGENAKPVPQPLDRCAARENRALECIAARRGHRLEEPGGRRSALDSCVRKHEAARAVRRLRLAAVEAAVAEQGRLLVAGDPGDRERDAEQLGLADDLGGADEPGQQHRGRHRTGRAAPPTSRGCPGRGASSGTRSSGRWRARGRRSASRRARCRPSRKRAPSSAASVRASSHSSFVAEK